MDNLQYLVRKFQDLTNAKCFKPYYKWITFNTQGDTFCNEIRNNTVLNLIING